jgi:predicted nucleic acid-binding protein
MAKRILDTSWLITHWLNYSATSSTARTPESMEQLGKQLIDLRGTKFIATPVFIEMVAGVQSAAELKLTLAYLKPFVSIDEGRILPEDWQNARDYAQRVPRDGKRRQLGDCLIRAIADRCRCEVDRLDKRFPQ